MTYDPTRNVIYTSMSDVRYGMEDLAVLGDTSLRYDSGTSNDVRVPNNPCGCVYTLQLTSKDYNAVHMSALICGKPLFGIESFKDLSNTCDLDGIANPDNLHYDSNTDLLIIGEDSDDGHQNDAVWQLTLQDPITSRPGNSKPPPNNGANSGSTSPPIAGNLTRIMTVPYGAESTSVYVYNLADTLYFTATVQHPYVETDMDKIKEPENSGKAAWVGYLGPIPLSDIRGQSVSFEGIFPPQGVDRHLVRASPEVLIGPEGQLQALVAVPEAEIAAVPGPQSESLGDGSSSNGSASAGR